MPTPTPYSTFANTDISRSPAAKQSIRSKVHTDYTPGIKHSVKARAIAGALIVACGLMFSHLGLAAWRVSDTKNLGAVLIQKEISANRGSPIVALLCLPEPTLIVEWFDNLSDISISIDAVELDVLMQSTMRNKMQAITLKSAHLQGLINGFKLQLGATLASGEKYTAETSLIGFTNEFNSANMNCSN